MWSEAAPWMGACVIYGGVGREVRWDGRRGWVWCLGCRWRMDLLVVAGEVVWIRWLGDVRWAGLGWAGVRMQTAVCCGVCIGRRPDIWLDRRWDEIRLAPPRCLNLLLRTGTGVCAVFYFVNLCLLCVLPLLV
jgi:hypothetical protein